MSFCACAEVGLHPLGWGWWLFHDERGAGRQACPWTVWVIPHPAGVVREVNQSPRPHKRAGGFAWEICKWVVFRRFAALDVRSDYSVEYFFIPGGSSPVVLPSLSAHTRLPH